MTAAALVFALATAATACGGSEQPPRAVAPTVAVPCDRKGPLLVFEAGDGFTFHNRLTLAHNGGAHVEYSTHFGPRPFRLTEGSTSFTADGEDLRRVGAALADSEFARLEERYVAAAPGADLPSYEIAHCGKRVFVDGFAIEEGRVPARLLRLVDVLDDLVEPEVEQALRRR